MNGPRYAMPFRRRREGKTDFRARRFMLYSGRPRLVVRKSLSHTWAQVVVVGKQGDSVVASAHSKELAAYGWSASTSNTPAAYLTGLLCGMRAKKAGVEDAILDAGLLDIVKGSKIFACTKGFSDSEITIPFDESIIPSEDRINGSHIVSYYESLDDDQKASRFSKYAKNNVDVASLPEMFGKAKNEIIDKEQ